MSALPRTFPSGRASLIRTPFMGAILTLAIGASLLAACSGQLPAPGGPTLSAGSSTTTGSTVYVSEYNASGLVSGPKSVSVRVGSHVLLVLHSDYWGTADDSAPAVLPVAAAPPVDSIPSASATATCSRVPGSGCGLFVRAFLAARPGTAVLSVSRTTCGEAYRCQPDESSFKVTVTVTG